MGGRAFLPTRRRFSADVRSGGGAGDHPRARAIGCNGGQDNCGALKNWTCDGNATALIFNEFSDHTSCHNNTVSNCFGRLICQGQACVCTANAIGSFSSSCSDCVNSCGMLSGCKCEGVVLTQNAFDYSSCPSLAVANCFGALICQGEPCK